MDKPIQKEYIIEKMFNNCKKNQCSSILSSEMSNKTLDIILDTIDEEPEYELIANKYTLHEKLGEGSFGTVYRATDFENNDYAIKFEDKSDKKKHLLRENKIYNTLAQLQGFPMKYYYGEYKNCRVLVLDKLGNSLKKIFHNNRQKFNINTVGNIAVQLLYRLEELHKKGWLHQDIKPENILIDNSVGKKLYLVDYGTSGYWWDKQLNCHVTNSDCGKIVGTARYSCIRNHHGKNQNRADDLESLGYMLVYFMKGGLPWQGVPAKDFRVKWRKIKRIKEIISNKELCKDLPICFKTYFDYVEGLGYTDTPDYSFLRRLFRLYIISDFFWCRE